MANLNPAVPNNIFPLKRHESMGDYARAYGDEIARRYEDLNIIFFPYFPITLDLEFLRSVTFPLEFKKLGTQNGIDRSPFQREGNTVAFDPNPALLHIFPQKLLAGYVQSLIIDVNWQIRAALRTLLPRYYSLAEGNITWRLTETINEPMHADGFSNGKPAKPGLKGAYHRIKLFINIDSEPRKWWTSYTLPENLKRIRERFPQGLPADVDQLSYLLQYEGVFRDLPYHEIDIPPMGAVLAEGSSIAHAVRFGRRMIAAEFFCHTADMLAPEKQPDIALPGWLKAAGIPIDPVPRTIERPAGGDFYDDGATAP